jgi:hypothetical protein
MKDCEKDLLLIAAGPQSVQKARIVRASMEEGEQGPHAALGDVFLWMDNVEPILLREPLRLRNMARFWERMADRSSLHSSEGSPNGSRHREESLRPLTRPAAGGVRACLAWMAVWEEALPNTPGLLAPDPAARSSADTVSWMQDQRPQAAPARLPIRLPPARSGWHTYRAT